MQRLALHLRLKKCMHLLTTRTSCLFRKFLQPPHMQRHMHMCSFSMDIGFQRNAIQAQNHLEMKHLQIPVQLLLFTRSAPEKYMMLNMRVSQL